MKRPLLHVDAVSFDYPNRDGTSSGPVLDQVALHVHDGEFVAVIGRNGCGKSTLLGVLSGALRPVSGRVLLRDGSGASEIGELPPKRRAKRVAVLHQSLPPLPAVTVRGLVEQGRYAHRGVLGMLAPIRDAEIAGALEAVGLLDHADRRLEELSGGERQRARLALALAQQPEILLLDEPTVHLDVHHQLQMLELLDRLRRERGLTLVCVLHELDHAVRFATRLVAMHRGRVVADGPAGEIVDEGLLREVYAVNGRVRRDDLTGRLFCLIDRPA